MMTIGLRRQWCRFLFVVVCAGAGMTGAAYAQMPAGLPTSTTAAAEQPAPPVPAVAPADGAAKLRAVAERRERIEKAIARFKAEQPNAEVSSDWATALDLLKYLELIYTQQQAAADLTRELQDRKTAATGELETLRAGGPTEKKPYSFLLLDELRDELYAAEAHQAAAEAEIEAARQMLESVRRTREEAERQRRLAKEAVDNNRDPQAAARLDERLDVTKLYSELAGEVIALKEAEITNNQRKLELAQLRVTFVREKLDVIQRDASFSRQDLDIALANVQKLEEDLRQELLEVQNALKNDEQQWLQTKQLLAERPEAERPMLEEQLAAWQLAQDRRKSQLSLLNERLGDVVIVRYTWDCRYYIVNGKAKPDDQLRWKQTFEQAQERLRRGRELLDIRLQETSLELQTREKRLRLARVSNPAAAPWIERQIQELQQLTNLLGSNVTRIEMADRLLKKVLGEIAAQTEPAAATAWVSTAARLLKTCWNYEITAVDDRPITVSKIVGGLVLLLIGYLLSRRLSRFLGARMLPRFGLNEGACSAFQTIAFYLLLAMFGFFTLELVSVPVTVFTFMGGAIAIGVGFGSQNVLNNFISGLILLAERPIRVGDLVEIDGLHGTVEQIGARSTRIKTGSNLEIIVPNSNFLENNVTNWTLSDTLVRTCVSVGVAYGAPTREVARLLMQVALADPRILPRPEPVVVFKEFGDNALVFEVHFFINMRASLQRMKVESDLRFAIEDAFRSANISIAFPQRDVHVDAIRPIEIRLLGLDGLGGGLDNAPLNRAA